MKLNNHPALRLLFALMLCMALCAAPGCNKKTTFKSLLTGHVEGRDVVAEIDGPAMIQPESDRATVTTGAHKIVVEKERVVLDGVELAKLPGTAPKVEINVAAGTLTVTADGARIVQTPLQN